MNLLPQVLLPELIEISDLSVQFGTVRALDRMNLSIRKGEFVSLLGPSGCGKSTLLKAIAGLIPVTDGKVTISDPTLRLGLMFQKPLLLPWRTVLRNVLLPIEIQRGSRTMSTVDINQAEATLKLVGLSDFADAYAHQLSGGMQQRAALARTLMSDPDVLLLDEPFGALDEMTRHALNEELISIWQSGHTRLRTIVMVTHSVPEAVGMSDRVFILAPRPARLLDIVDIKVAHPRQIENQEVARLISQVRRTVRSAP
jgi:NitT/TauT family transport system ATP-binding protein